MIQEKDYYTVKAMRIYGGSFVQALAMAFEYADSVNAQKIKDTWPEYWNEYETMGEGLTREE